MYYKVQREYCIGYIDKISCREGTKLQRILKIAHCKGRSGSMSRLPLRVKLQGNRYCVMTGACTRYTENDDNRITAPL